MATPYSGTYPIPEEPVPPKMLFEVYEKILHVLAEYNLPTLYEVLVLETMKLAIIKSGLWNHRGSNLEIQKEDDST